MNKNILSVLILIIGIFAAGIAVAPVAAQTEISYPVAELGNCADRTACKAYCDQPANIEACLNFAEKKNLMSGEEIKAARSFKKTGMTGPGGCKGKDECNKYCSGPEHMDECVTFAEKNGLMSGAKLDEAKKVRGAIGKGIKPPACGGKEACDAYCSSEEHVEECLKFGEAAGTIKKEDADTIRKGKGKKGKDSGNGPGGGKQGPKGPDGQGGGGKKGPGGPPPGDR